MLRSLLPLLLAFFLGQSGFAQTVSGSWTARPSEKDASSINVQFVRNGDRHSNLGENLPLKDLSGLTRDSMNSPGSDVKFQLNREAGNVAFDGHFREGLGVGKFTFTANHDFLAGMSALGYPNLGDEQLFELAVINVTQAFTRELNDIGFHPGIDKLVEARIFNINREQVEGLKQLGYSGLSLDKLVELRIFKITPEYIQQMKAAGLGSSLEDLTAMRIHGVTPEFRQQMAQAGYAELSAQKLVEFRIHGVTPEFMKEMAGLGFQHLSADELVELRIFHVNAEQVQELKKLGYTGLTAKQLVEMRIHHIDSEFIQRVQRAGYQHPSLDELVQMKLFGVHKNAAVL